MQKAALLSAEHKKHEARRANNERGNDRASAEIHGRLILTRRCGTPQAMLLFARQLAALSTRFSACALACLVLGAQLAPALHFLLVSHVRCAVHGELVHSPEHGSSLTQEYDHNSVASTDDESRDEHEHCGFAFLGISAVTLPGDAGIDAQIARASTNTRAPAGCAHAISAVEILQFAPKASPPRALPI